MAGNTGEVFSSKASNVEDIAVVRQLTIQTRLAEAGQHQDNTRDTLQAILLNEEQLTSRLSGSLVSRRKTTWSKRSSSSHSLASTPPPEEELPSQGQLIRGIGGAFPGLLSRASSLTFGSEHPSDASLVVTPRRGSEVSDFDNGDETPTAPTSDLGRVPGEIFVTPTINTQARMAVIVPVINPFTPSPSPHRKRATSPPSTPRPMKRSRSHPRDASQDLRNPSPSEEYFRELGTQQFLRNAKQRTAELSFLDAQSPNLGDIETHLLAQSEVNEVRLDNMNRRIKSPPDSEIMDQTDGISVTAIDSSIRSHTQWNTPSSIEFEWFTEEEIEVQLSSLLGAYRAFYTGSDKSHDDEEPGDAMNAQKARHTFKIIFENQLNSAVDEEFLWKDEKEDVLNVFMEWIGHMEIPWTIQTETFPDLHACLDHLTASAGMYATWPFIRNIRLLLGDNAGHRLLDNLPRVRGADAPSIRGSDGVVVWNFKTIFCSLD
ncbi:hypothetical protein B0T25DRAFT_575050 [Lasiosphaeria hispida]|uniref:Uncharacterized protein n=1 Tax=Lasiosphaeria hispida TaxID=260671 RepID=A0AAJ0HSW4_9PEZI|nr:hypothetical protein B0T25DRAFT_575050 [Lasiosphaeria hispida]